MARTFHVYLIVDRHCILLSPGYCQFYYLPRYFHGLLDRKVLSGVSVDKAHLFIQFGLWFRDEFCLLWPFCFNRLRTSSSYLTKVPVLFMTAADIICQLEKLTGLSFLPCTNVLWPSLGEMKNWKVKITARYTTRPFEHLSQ
jgi:hypothetical protein